jgi:hypothetical protein
MTLKEAHQTGKEYRRGLYRTWVRMNDFGELIEQVTQSYSRNHGHPCREEILADDWETKDKETP